MFLMGNNKCETFFPRLTAKDLIRGNSNKCAKKSSTQKMRNMSIDKEGKFRLTYHDILQVPVSKSITNGDIKEEEESETKKVFVKKQVDSVIRIGSYQVNREIGKGGFAEVVEGQDSSGNKFAIKQYVLQNSL